MTLRRAKRARNAPPDKGTRQRYPRAKDRRLKVWLESSIAPDDSNRDRRTSLWHLGAAGRLNGFVHYVRS